MTCATTEVIPLQIGGDGSMYMVYTDADTGEPIDISTGYEIYMDFINPKTGSLLKQTGIGNGITLQTEIGEFVVDPGDITGWPEGPMPVDILYINLGKARPTNRFVLDIKQALTMRP